MAMSDSEQRCAELIELARSLPEPATYITPPDRITQPEVDAANASLARLRVDVRIVRGEIVGLR